MVTKISMFYNMSSKLYNFFKFFIQKPKLLVYIGLENSKLMALIVNLRLFQTIL